MHRKNPAVSTPAMMAPLKAEPIALLTYANDFNHQGEQGMEL